jgi:hypothetical protein
MVENDLVFVRDCAIAKLFGMLTVTVGVFLLVIAGLDASIEALLSGGVLVPFGIVFACLDEKMTVSFQEKAIFKEFYSGGKNLAFFNKTIHFHEPQALFYIKAIVSHVVSGSRQAEATFIMILKMTLRQEGYTLSCLKKAGYRPGRTHGTS